MAVLAGIAAVYLWRGADLFFNQEKYLYFPITEWTATPESVKLRYEDVRFRSADGTELSGWFVPAERERAVVLFCHGNARNISSELDVLSMFHDLGVSAFFFDYRGYGKSAGRPGEAGLYADAAAAWQYLASVRDVPSDRILIWGRSLGAAVASELATHHRPRALVLEAAFTSIQDLASELYPIFPVRALLYARFETMKNLRAASGTPVLIVHSREDDLVPMRHGRALYEAAGEPKHFLEIAGPHGGLPFQKVYWDGVRAFLDDLLGPARA